MRDLADWLLERLKALHPLRSRGRVLSPPELDAQADLYGFPLPASLRSLIRLSAEYELPALHGLTWRLRPGPEVLPSEPTPFGPRQWLPLALRFGGLYPIGTTSGGDCYAVGLFAPIGAVYRWTQQDARAVLVCSSVEAFIELLLEGRLPTEGDSSPLGASIVNQFAWIEAFLARRYTDAARYWVERRPSPPKEETHFEAYPPCALFWLLDAFLLDEQERYQKLSAHMAGLAPLARRLRAYCEAVASGDVIFGDDLTEARAQFWYELARVHERLSLQERQSLLLRAITRKAPIERVLGALTLATLETARSIAVTLEGFSINAEPSRAHELSALSVLALAYAKEEQKVSERADLLAWTWRQDPWYGTRPGEAERLSHLVSAYSMVNRHDRAELLLSFLQEKAPAAGPTLAAKVDLLSDTGDIEGAATELKRALQICPVDPHVHASRMRLATKGKVVSWIDPAWPFVLQSLAQDALSGDAATRISALERLRRLLESHPEPPALPFLLTIVEADPVGRPGALKALAHSHFEEAIPVLSSWAARTDDPNHQDLAIQALQQSPLPAAKEALAALGLIASEPHEKKNALSNEDIAAFDRRLREEGREAASQIVQLAASRAAWTQDPGQRDDLQSIRALAMAKSGMLRDAVELADVLAWGWRQDPLCGERPGEPERFARLVDTYRVSNRLDRAKPLLAFLRQKSSSDAPLAVEIDLALDANQEEQAKALLWEGLSRYPGSRWLHSCRSRLGKNGRSFWHGLADPSWPKAVHEVLEGILSAELSERVKALSSLATALKTRRQSSPAPAPLELPFLLSLAYHDAPEAAHAAFLAICAHPFASAKPLLRTKAEGPDHDDAATAIQALASLGDLAGEDFSSFIKAGLYHKVPGLLVTLAEGQPKGPMLREALLAAISREGLSGAWLGPWLLRALAPSATKEDVLWVEPLLSSSHSVELRLAALTLLEASGESLQQWVEPLLLDEQPEIVAAAQRLLPLDANPKNELNAE